MKLAYLDFEFTGISEPELTLVSLAVRCIGHGEIDFVREFWLFQGGESKMAKNFLLHLIGQGYIFVSFVMEAEARSIMTLFGGWDERIKAIDLYLEYRCLLNHCHELSYGRQYIGGKVIVTKPKPAYWDRVDNEDGDEDDLHHKPEYSLAAATFKLLETCIDTEEKTAVRDLIIRGKPEEILANRERIQKYNMSDICYLQPMLRRIVGLFRERGIGGTKWLEHALKRGDYAIATAKMLRLGYPVNVPKLEKFEANVHKILKASVEAVLEADKSVEAFVWDKRWLRYRMCEKEVRRWIEAQDKPGWRKTNKGRLSLSKDAFNDWFDSTSDGFGGAFYRHLKTKQSLNGFMPVAKGKKKKRFKDFLGSDGRVRPYFGIYGSQSSRSQPGATGYIPLKAHWMRTFIEAPPGKALASLDYSSEEFLLAAIMSQDKAMMEAYQTGDVYLAFALRSKMVPPGATKASHKKERDRAKTMVLGMSYDMGAANLASRLGCGQTEAEGLIEMFFEVYPDYAQWKLDTQKTYRDEEHLMLPDGWCMWGDNPNRRSVGNFPIQGEGARVMREAVKLAQSRGLNVLLTLHDSLTIEFNSFEFGEIAALKGCMSEAFETCMKQYGETLPIGLEGEAWSRDYATEPPPPIPGITFMETYCDDKGRADLERYRKFFD